jgi:hypothetical protein
MLDPLKPTSVPIEAAAHRILEQSESYPGLRPLNVKETVLRFIENPSQTWYPVSLWLLQLTPASALVRRIEWDRNTDRRFPKAAPHTFGADAEIQLNDANALVEDLRRVSFPPFLSKQYGLDGVTQTIEFWNEGVRTTAISWEGMPAEWQPFADWYSRARTLFESHLPLSTAQNQLSNREPEPHRPIRSLRQR